MHTSYIVCGSPGAGKSTYARQLAASRSATLLDIDTVTERLVETGLAFDGLVEVRTGLQAGARVVVQGNETLQGGQRVAIQSRPPG